MELHGNRKLFGFCRGLFPINGKTLSLKLNTVQTIGSVFNVEITYFTSHVVVVLLMF